MAANIIFTLSFFTRILFIKIPRLKEAFREDFFYLQTAIVFFPTITEVKMTLQLYVSKYSKIFSLFCLIFFDIKMLIFGLSFIL